MPSFLRICRVFVVVFLSLGSLSQTCYAQEATPAETAATEEDDDAPRSRPAGWLATFHAGDRSISRREYSTFWNWEQASPDVRLPTGAFRARWTGLLFVRSPGTYRFLVRAQGQMSLTIGTQAVLTVSSPARAFHTSEPFDLEYGEHPVVLEFEKTEPSASLSLLWSSDSFPWEPIPAAALMVDQIPPAVELQSRGQELLEGARCQLCHLRPDLAPPPLGPDLTHIGHEVSTAWILQRLTKPGDWSQHSQMPEFGFTPQQAQQIAAYLQSVSGAQPQWASVASASKAEAGIDRAAHGKLLAHSLGCLACHALNGVGGQQPLGGGELTRIGEKRSRDWLRTWLLAPAKIKPAHRMPQFSLSPSEAESLAGYLSTLGAQSPPSNASVTATPEDIAAGRELIIQARCAACHQLPGPQLDMVPVAAIQAAALEKSGTCLDTKLQQPFQPRYPQLDPAAVRAYLTTMPAKTSPEDLQATGERQLRQNNCLACHPRQTTTGLGAWAKDLAEKVPELAGQSATLVPPSLTAVGDKLLPQALDRAVGGDLQPVRLPWLRVRMPKFKHRAEDRAALVQYFRGHDLVETPPAATPSQPFHVVAQQADQALVDGTALLGGQGFSCTACHRIGKFEPKNVALGTRGSDLQNLAQRMRPEYYLRWTRAPMRVVADSEMPGFVKPLEHVLDGQIDTQLAAVWHALNSPQLVVPTDPSTIQQIVTIEPNHPPRIIRDVFALPASKSRPEHYVPRSFAIGFSNRYNLLFDLQTGALQQAWLGTFARQKTQGKSWYWEAGGVPLLQQPLDFSLTNREAPATWLKRASLRLREYAAVSDGVRCTWDVDFTTADGAAQTLRVTSTWKELDKENSPQPSLLWQLEIAGLHAGQALQWPLPADGPLTFRQAHETALPPAKRAALSISGDDDGHARLTLIIQSPLHAPPNALPLPPPFIAESIVLDVVPGFTAQQLPLPRSIMPTAMTWTHENKLAFTSLKGHVFIAHDRNGDGLEDDLQLYEEGLAAPYGILADGPHLLVSQKPEILRLRDVNADGQADQREVVATGWGYNDNYHDWTHGLVRDKQGRLFVGLGSDYAQPERPQSDRLWRGKILRIDPDGSVTPIAGGFRYPTGLALNADDELFATDNQGVQNTFNELNHIVTDGQYGVPSLDDPQGLPARAPAIQIPHPWTRSVNGIFFLPADYARESQTPHLFAGHLIGCEYDTHFLVRMTLQQVDGVYQGAIYPFSREQVPADQPNFEGALSGGVSPSGAIYIGSIHDSGWLGGRNTGSLVKITPNSELPLGIRELLAIPGGFEVHFTQPVAPQLASQLQNYSLSGYTREWQGAYSTPDTQRQAFTIHSAVLSEDRRSVKFSVAGLKTGFVYELTCRGLGADRNQPLFPATAAYTLHKLPL